MAGIKKIIQSFKELKWYENIMMVVMIVIAVYYAIMPNDNPKWLSILNLISGICGVICVFLTAKANRVNFFFACINTMVYIVYLWYWKIYGTMALELFIYAPMNIISWINWSKHIDQDNDLLTKSKKMTPIQNIVTTVVIVLSTIVYHTVLNRLGGIVTWLDGATFAIGIIAVFLEMKRYREQYIWWLVTDVVAVIMYIVHFDPVYLTKKIIYLIEAIIGLVNWVKLSQKNKENE